jgi:hypothetical protein
MKVELLLLPYCIFSVVFMHNVLEDFIFIYLGWSALLFVLQDYEVLFFVLML